MTLSGLVIREMARRRLGLILSILAAVVATAAYVSVETLSWSAQDALRAVMLKLGHNILIVPKGAPRDRMWTGQFGEFEMPEDRVDELSRDHTLDVEHYVARLQRRVKIGDALVILTGVRPVSIANDERETATLGFEFHGPRDAHIGAALAERLGKDVGDTVDVGDAVFTIRHVREPLGGSIDDFRLYVPLKTVQDLYEKPGRIDSIAALGRVRPGAREPLRAAKAQIVEALGGAVDVVVVRGPFVARDKSRRMLRTMGLVLSAALLALCGLGLALYIYHNVSERQYETALLVALGYRPSQVTVALLSKVLFVGVTAGVVGLLAGTAISVAAGPSIVAVEAVRPLWGLWWRALAFAMGLCLAAAAVAVWAAFRAAPAQVLRNH